MQLVVFEFLSASKPQQIFERASQLVDPLLASQYLPGFVFGPTIAKYAWVWPMMRLVQRPNTD